jgi:ferritin-like metal-binding protein YciE
MRYSLHTLRDLYISQLHELYSIEDRLVLNLRNVIDAVTSSSLKKTLAKYFIDTKEHLKRLEYVFEYLAESPHLGMYEPIEGLIHEMQSMVDELGDAKVKDAAIITRMQSVIHYKIALYGATRTFAKHLGNGYVDQVNLLEKNLKKEHYFNKSLIQIAEGNWIVDGVNAKAASN